MKRQILHMVKYKYVPFNIGKQVSVWCSVIVCPLRLHLLKINAISIMGGVHILNHTLLFLVFLECMWSSITYYSIAHPLPFPSS
jgi:hypothetical protein